VDISVAVATPTGLMVPVLRNTENMSFATVEKVHIHLFKMLIFQWVLHFLSNNKTRSWSVSETKAKKVAFLLRIWQEEPSQFQTEVCLVLYLVLQFWTLLNQLSSACTQLLTGQWSRMIKLSLDPWCKWFHSENCKLQNCFSLLCYF